MPIRIQMDVEASAVETEEMLEKQITDLYSDIHGINSRSLKFFNQMKQLASDHYNWLKR